MKKIPKILFATFVDILELFKNSKNRNLEMSVVHVDENPVKKTLQKYQVNHSSGN